ncbi:MAG: imidazolonepropionase [Acidobacteriota bacterium]|nr:imidazolonepropionase [Acidobacteriota bacterium]
MISSDLIIANCSQLLTCRGPVPKRGKDLQNVGAIENGCIASLKGRIVFVGETENLENKVHFEKDAEFIDGSGLVGLPGFIDSHTHLPFAGSREEEFVLRLQGYTYQQIAEKGLGIQTTVNATRKATKEELINLCLCRLNTMLLHGTTTAEAKSGYGLNIKDELKQLQVLKELNERHPVDIVPTFMGAHEVPKEYKGRKQDYIELLINEALPEVKKNNLAEFFDVFCEQGVYSIEDTRQLIRAAKKQGFKIKIHADEFAPLGGTQLAVEEEATSADHLMAVTEEGIQALSRSSTVATMLPAVPFFLMQEKKAPARKLIDKGAIVALATDFNPGSSMTESMLFILQLAVFTLNMGIEEAINASTVNAAYALSRHEDVGTLEKGKKMDVILCEIPNYLHLAYHLGINPIKHVIKNGKLVVKDKKVLTTANPILYSHYGSC